MNQLRHTEFRSDGIFGVFTFDGDDDPFMVTLEHAYDDGNGGFAPKLSAGTYTCVRGIHALHNGVRFETFEITGVEGHAGILFHAGNFNRDSEGCVLCGISEVDSAQGEMVTGSKARFEAFMGRLENVDEFTLEVVDA